MLAPESGSQLEVPGSQLALPSAPQSEVLVLPCSQVSEEPESGSQCSSEVRELMSEPQSVGSVLESWSGKAQQSVRRLTCRR